MCMCVQEKGEREIQEVDEIHITGKGAVSLCCCCCSVTKLCPTLHEPVEHSMLPCPLPVPRVCSNSCAVIQPSLPLLQHHSSKATIWGHSAFFMVQVSHPYLTTGKKKKNIALTKQTLKKGHFPLFLEITLVLIGMEATNWRSLCHIPCVVCVCVWKWKQK